MQSAAAGPKAPYDSVVHVTRASIYDGAMAGRNVLAALEAEVAVGVSAGELAARADVTITLRRARSFLSNMGYDISATSLTNPSIASALRAYSQRMTPEEIQEFMKRACTMPSYPGR